MTENKPKPKQTVAVIQCTPEEKSEWVHQAKTEGKKLNDWAKERLNNKAKVET